MTHGDHFRFQEQEDALAIYLLTYGIVPRDAVNLGGTWYLGAKC